MSHHGGNTEEEIMGHDLVPMDIEEGPLPPTGGQEIHDNESFM